MEWDSFTKKELFIGNWEWFLENWFNFCRDLAARNVLVRLWTRNSWVTNGLLANKGREEKYCCKNHRFWWAHFLRKISHCPTGMSRFNVNYVHKTRGKVIPYKWSAPERALSEYCKVVITIVKIVDFFFKESDVWSFGVTIGTVRFVVKWFIGY